VNGLWGKKVGMTQIFQGDKVVPVTVVDVAHWFVIAVKTVKKDDYDAIQVGCVRLRYKGKTFLREWASDLKKYFQYVREIKIDNNKLLNNFTIGQCIDLSSQVDFDNLVDVTGVTKGAGFAGVVRRHNFRGARASHGDTMGKRTGSIGSLTACGKVIKGKKMPGRMGGKQRTMKSVPVVSFDKDANLMLVKGSIPGKSGTLVFVRKAIQG
jgi:large subunit ribosomal protein L3